MRLKYRGDRPGGRETDRPERQKAFGDRELNGFMSMSANRKPARRMAAIIAIGTLSLGLAGCGGGGLTDALGMGKNAPDEFAVVTKAPLVIPPDYSLRPPEPGAPRPQEASLSPSATAQEALIGGNGQSAPAAETMSPGEKALLANAGADKADPRIRQVVNAESRSLVERDDSFVDDVLFWKDGSTPPAEPMVNAPEEAKRIRANTAEGKPATEGETPTVEPEEKGILEDIF